MGLAVLAAAVLSQLYASWVSLPIVEPRTLGRAYAEGVVGAAIAGAVLAVALGGLEMLAVLLTAIVAGHALAVRQMSDVNLSFTTALDLLGGCCCDG